MHKIIKYQLFYINFLEILYKKRIHLEFRKFRKSKRNSFSRLIETKRNEILKFTKNRNETSKMSEIFETKRNESKRNLSLKKIKKKNFS